MDDNGPGGHGGPDDPGTELKSRRGRILVVDDEPDVRRAHARLLERFGHETEQAADGIEALTLLPLGFDLILCDADMPNMDGFEVARRIRQHPDHGHVPVVMVTGLVGHDDRLRAYETGVNDFLSKPIEATELRLRIHWLLELKAARDELDDHKQELERTVERRTRDLRQALLESADAKRSIRDAHLDTIRRLSLAAEYKDQITGGHIERIGRFAELVAREIGMAPGQIELIRHSAPMHDVGKLGVPDQILLKPGRLDPAELEIMRTHARIGADLLAGSDSDVIRMGRVIALSHHERWDGGGYPAGLSGPDIPLEARICATVDVFDALTSVRPYRKPLSNDEVYQRLRDDAEGHFDPTLVEAFLDVRARVEEIQEEYTGPVRGGARLHGHRTPGA